MELEETIAGVVELGLYDLLRQRLVKPVAVAQPSAGAEWSAPVPGGVWWEPLYVSHVFTTSAVVANRGPHLIGTAPDGRMMRVPPAAVQAASAGVLYNYANIGAQYGAGGVSVGVALPMPPLALPPGSTLGSLTTALDVGDAYTSVLLYVREWSAAQVFAAAEWLRGHSR